MAKTDPNCASCPHLAVDRDVRGWPRKGAIGFCRLRDFTIEKLEESECANHPRRNILGFLAPVGPIWVDRLPVVFQGVAYFEESPGGFCEHCGNPVSGDGGVVWHKDDQRVIFCSGEHYLSWAGEKDPSIPVQTEPSKEDLAELRRLWKGLGEIEVGMKRKKVEPVEKLPDLLQFTGPALYRYLRAKKMLPKKDLSKFWPDLFRGAPPETRERVHPWRLEVQLSIRDLMTDPPDIVPTDVSERAYEYARIRWVRMVLGDLLGIEEGPEVPKDVDKRFRGRHRPSWRDGETNDPVHARHIFYIERNPDLEEDLSQFFGVARSTD
jgi:hypothetical protein